MQDTPAKNLLGVESNDVVNIDAPIVISEKDEMKRVVGETRLPERRAVSDDVGTQGDMVVYDTRLGATKPHQHAIAEDGTTAIAHEAHSVEQASSAQDHSSVVPLHTLKDDLQMVIKEQKISLVRAATLEEDRNSEKKQSVPLEVPQGKKGIAWKVMGIVCVIVLLLVGVGIIQSLYVAPPPSDGSLMFAERSEVLPIQHRSGFDLKNMLMQARQHPNISLGSLVRIVPTVSPEDDVSGKNAARPATFSEFITALDTHVPDDLLRALGDDFFFGIHATDRNALVFVVPVTSYERAFAGMLAWEQTINADLQPASAGVPDQVVGSNGLPEKRRFGDVVLENYDARTLKDDSGDIVLYYVFPTKHLLIIGESPYSLKEVLARLRVGKAL